MKNDLLLTNKGLMNQTPALDLNMNLINNTSKLDSNIDFLNNIPELDSNINFINKPEKLYINNPYRRGLIHQTLNTNNTKKLS